MALLVRGTCSMAPKGMHLMQLRGLRVSCRAGASKDGDDEFSQKPSRGNATDPKKPASVKSEAELLRKLLGSTKSKGPPSGATSEEEPAQDGVSGPTAKKSQPTPPKSAQEQQQADRNNTRQLFSSAIEDSVERAAEAVADASSSGTSRAKAKEDLTQKLSEMRVQSEQRARGVERKSEADALRKLFGLAPLASGADGESSASSLVDSITNTIKSMRVERSAPSYQEPKPRFAAPSPTSQPMGRTAKREATLRAKVNLYEGDRLNIFTPPESVQAVEAKSTLKEWPLLVQETISRKYSKPPRSGFEEFINWTKEGKLWPYPIDNDYLSEEKNIEFHEHVFLESKLEGFPETGPIRHFMELVILGLSKNPFMSLEVKHGHIDWFRKYFEEMGPQITKLHALETKHSM